MIKISLCNQSTTFSDADLVSLAQAMQIQINRDFYPAWGVPAQIYWTPTGFHPSADHWVMGLFDISDQPGALGYHDVTPTGLPLGKIFVKTTLADGGFVSVTVSHEVLEALVDPDINLCAELDDSSGRPVVFYAYEVGDPVEADADGYDIDIPAGITGGPAKIRVSDFALPSWFESFNQSGKYDFMGHLKRPFSLNPGGYISYLNLGNLGAGWQQKTAKTTMSARARMVARPHLGSRRSKRALPRTEWITSTYTPGDVAKPAEVPPVGV